MYHDQNDLNQAETNEYLEIRDNTIRSNSEDNQANTNEYTEMNCSLST